MARLGSAAEASSEKSPLTIFKESYGEQAVDACSFFTDCTKFAIAISNGTATQRDIQLLAKLVEESTTLQNNAAKAFPEIHPFPNPNADPALKQAVDAMVRAEWINPCPDFFLLPDKSFMAAGIHALARNPEVVGAMRDLKLDPNDLANTIFSFAAGDWKKSSEFYKAYVDIATKPTLSAMNKERFGGPLFQFGQDRGEYAMEWLSHQISCDPSLERIVSALFTIEMETKYECQACPQTHLEKWSSPFLYLKLNDLESDTPVDLEHLLAQKARQKVLERCREPMLRPQLEDIFSNPEDVFVKTTTFSFKTNIAVEFERRGIDSKTGRALAFRTTTPIGLPNRSLFKSKREYYLRAVIYHVDRPGESGHYFTDARDDEKSEWIRHDNETRTKVENPSIEPQRNAMMAFYARVRQCGELNSDESTPESWSLPIRNTA